VLAPMQGKLHYILINGKLFKSFKIHLDVDTECNKIPTLDYLRGNTIANALAGNLLKVFQSLRKVFLELFLLILPLEKKILRYSKSLMTYLSSRNLGLIRILIRKQVLDEKLL
jgi:hypothetical protein